MEKELKYVAPELEVLEVLVETGFAASQGGGAEVDPDDFGGSGSPF